MRRGHVLLLAILLLLGLGAGQPPRLGAAGPSTPHATPLAATTVVAWSDDTFGQSWVPATLSGAVQVSGGNFYTLALKSVGTVVAWGSDQFGQTTVPVGLSGVVQVAAGGSHAVALVGPPVYLPLITRSWRARRPHGGRGDTGGGLWLTGGSCGIETSPLISGSAGSLSVRVG